MSSAGVGEGMSGYDFYRGRAVPWQLPALKPLCSSALPGECAKKRRYGCGTSAA